MTKTANAPKTMLPINSTERTVSGSAGAVARHPLPALTPEDRARYQEKAAETKKAQREAWEKLPLRQSWADEAHMRGFLVRYGVRLASDIEPATAARLKTFLQRAGLNHYQWTEAVGCNLDRFLELNPNLPLWAAVALVLESAS